MDVNSECAGFVYRAGSGHGHPAHGPSSDPADRLGHAHPDRQPRRPGPVHPGRRRSGRCGPRTGSGRSRSGLEPGRRRIVCRCTQGASGRKSDAHNTGNGRPGAPLRTDQGQRDLPQRRPLHRAHGARDAGEREGRSGGGSSRDPAPGEHPHHQLGHAALGSAPGVPDHQPGPVRKHRVGLDPAGPHRGAGGGSDQDGRAGPARRVRGGHDLGFGPDALGGAT